MKFSKINIEYYREEFDKELSKKDKKKKVRKKREENENQLNLFD